MSILVDRSRIETDWACARKRYWLTEYTDDLDGPVHPARPIGIVPSTPSPALASIPKRWLINSRIYVGSCIMDVGVAAE